MRWKSNKNFFYYIPSTFLPLHLGLVAALKYLELYLTVRNLIKGDKILCLLSKALDFFGKINYNLGKTSRNYFAIKEEKL